MTAAASQPQPGRAAGLPALRALATLVLAGLVVVGLTLLPDSRFAPLSTSLDAADAAIHAFILRTLGFDAQSNGNVVVCGTAALRIGFGCNGLLPFGLLLAAVLAMGASWKAKGIGLAVGALAVGVVNHVRLLMLTAVANTLGRDMFELFHVAVGQVVVMLGVFLYWSAWAAWATPKAPVPPAPAPPATPNASA